MSVASMIPFNGPKLKADLETIGASQVAVSGSIGMGNTFLSTRIREKKIKPRQLRLICDKYRLDYQSYLIPDPAPAPAEEPEQSQVTEPAPSASIDPNAIALQLGEISKKLDKMVEVLTVRHPVFAKIEDCILLLQALTKYGACHYKTFEDKARASGMDEETMACAMNITGYRVFIGDGIKQISRK